MKIRADGVRVAYPLFQAGGGGSNPTSALQLYFASCPKMHAVRLVRQYHSRLPNVQNGPWMYAFDASLDGVSYAAALWSSPSGRCLPQQWIELRRMVVLPDAPRYTASRFLAWMVRWLKTNHAEHETAISYQDLAVHKGTIYKACGWTAAYTSKPRVRDRSKHRRGTGRLYRANINGIEADASAKVRWEKRLA